MQTRELTVRFLTPAFLGNAEQDGQWRAPPFKHLLREWWRMAWAEAHGFSNNYQAMRADEGALFGSAADGTGNRSRVRLRLSRWDVGKLKSWNGLEAGTVTHPEVKRTGCKVGPHAYLGFGPLDGRGGTKLGKPNAAIQAGEQAGLRLAFPEQAADLLDRALMLAHRFGTLGGRSRNGWGSLALDGTPALERLPLRDWRECLDRDWPHAIGRDNAGALIWRTEGFDDWRQLMRRLAQIKIGLRTQFPFHSGDNTPHPEARHWLSHPVTRHNVKPWRKGRLPNSLRFKVVAGDNGQLHGLIFHVPCLPPRQLFRPNQRAIEQVWQQVHGWLDEQGNLDRSVV